MVCLKKILAVALAAATIGTCSLSAMPVSAATAAYTISSEVANNSYSVVFKEPYTKDITFSKQAADGKYQEVTLSALDKFTVGVRKSTNFASTDKITVAKASSEKGPFTVVKTIDATASTFKAFTISQKNGTTAYYSVEVKNKNGTVLYAQRYKVVMAQNEIGNNQIKLSLTKNTVSNDASSAKTIGLSMATADNKATAFSFVDTYRYSSAKFKLDFTNLPDGASVQIDRKNISFRDVPSQVNSYKITSEGGTATYQGDVVSEGDAELITVTVVDINGTVVARTNFTAKGVYKNVEMRSALYYAYKNAYISGVNTKMYEANLGTESNLTSEYALSNNAVTNSRFVTVAVEKIGGSYLDAEKIDVMYKALNDTAFTRYKTISAAANNRYTCKVELPKLGTTYTVRLVMHLNSGKTLTQDFTNIKPMSNTTLGISESWYDGIQQEGVATKTTDEYYIEGQKVDMDVAKVSAFEIGPRNSQWGINNRDNTYKLSLGAMGSAADKVVVKVTQNGQTKTVYTGPADNPTRSFNLTQLGITPTLNGTAQVQVQLVNKSNKALITWNRNLKFVGASFFKFEMQLVNNGDTYFAHKASYSTTLKETMKYDTADVRFNSTMNVRMLTTDNIYQTMNEGHYQGLPINVDGIVYIKKAGDTARTKLCSVKTWMYNQYNYVPFSDVAASYGYFMEAGNKYTVTIEFKNKDTNKLCQVNSFVLNYVGNISY